MSEVSELQKIAQKIFGQIPKHDLAYFHKKSIDNFIYHLSSITNIDQRGNAQNIIKCYLNDINELISYQDFECNMELSEYFFKRYLNDLIKIYDPQLGFVPVFGRKAYIVMIPSVFLIFYLLRQNKTLFFLSLTLFFLYLIRIVFKSLKRKLYGFGY